MTEGNGSAATIALAKAFQDAITEAIQPIRGDIAKLEQRMGGIENRMDALEESHKASVRTLSARIDQLAQRLPS